MNEPPDSIIDVETALMIADYFKILADPTRIRLLVALSSREMCVTDLTRLLNMEQSAVSHQLKTLRSLHLVQHRKVGRQVFYSLSNPHIQEVLQQGMNYYQEVH
jgi:DNA-binding transcriptional ArsR family regulator